ncbi:alpha/beta-hydrolase [Rickenella mellea]|uniref:Alpha/beta-hydrolase n=1 Tax=Rickenella mellea TaxID=50990 RepID=A0A4R5XFZ9_9AGAM|nr:alpha/beta-hydrolase [Rickenella mellea]
MTAAVPTLPPAREIPSSFVGSVKSWWAAGEKDSAASEERLLRKLPFFQSDSWQRTDPSQPIIATSSRVTLSPKRHINTLSILPVSPRATSTSKPSPAVLLHGYGAGLGFFFRNFPTLGSWVAKSGSALYALDWLGMGRSSRPPFTITARRTDTEARVHQAESFFVDSLEEWRAAMGLERMTLIGHSLGAYFSVVYALRYPQHVDRLILLSPAGVPRGESASSPAQELTDDQRDMSSSNGSKNGNGVVKTPSRQEVKALEEETKKKKREQTRTQKLFTYLWEEGFSPFQVVRTLSVFGPLLVGKYSSRRFSSLTEEETRDMNDYILNITLAKGSGEYCISHILAPFAQARLPLVDRISAFKGPVTFVYGDHDWMDPVGGLESVEKLREAGNNQAQFYIIKNAGHHVYLDNAKAVNDLLYKELR